MKKAGVILILLVLLSSVVYASELKVTSEHPFLINNKWITANQLNVGDNLTLSNGRSAIIKNIGKVTSEYSFKVYNLETEKYHDFIVNGVIVHNSNAVYSTKTFKQLYQEINILKLTKEEGYRLNYAEEVLRRKLSDCEKKAILAAHEYKNDLLFDLSRNKQADVSKAKELRRTFGKVETRILMEKGIAGKLHFSSDGRSYWRLTKNTAISKDAVNKWVTRHSSRDIRNLLAPDSKRMMTQKEVSDFADKMISKFDNDFILNPERSMVEYPFTENGNAKKIIFNCKSYGGDDQFKYLVGGTEFHGDIFKIGE